MGFSHNGQDFEYKSPHGPYKEGWGTDNSRIDIQYVVPWADRWAARDALLGTAEVIGGLVPFISRTMPHVYPGTGLIARAVPSIEGEVPLQDLDLGGPPLFANAILNVLYESVSYEVASDAAIVGPASYPVADESLLLRWVTKRKSQATQYFSTRRGAWEFTDNGKKFHSDVPIQLPKHELNILWHQVPLAAYSESKYDDAIGKTNLTAFAGCGAGTLVFVNAAPEYTRLPTGSQERSVNLTLKMHHFPNGANFFPDPDRDNQFYEISRDGGTRWPFMFTEFATLMRP